MPRNPRADQIGTGGRIKSESPGGCARNAQLIWLIVLCGEFAVLQAPDFKCFAFDPFSLV